MILLGSDFSQYQGNVNWDIYKSNSNFVILKSSEGVGFTDSKFIRNQSEARRVGMPLGYYHFCRPDLGNSPIAEADWFLKVCGGLREGEVFTLDYEPNWPGGDAVGWSKGFLDRIQEKIGVKPLIYLNQSQVKSFNWQSVIDGGYGLWIAAYTYSPTNNTFETGKWPFAVTQQWSNKQSVPGVPTVADANVFFGDLAAFKKYGYKVPTPPTPTPPTNETAALKEKIKSLEAEKAAIDKDKQAWEAKYTVLRDGIISVCKANGIQVLL